jgi:hypothetical protein
MLPAALLLLSCRPSADREAAGETTSAAGETASLPMAMVLGETGGMSTPESVRYDLELDVYFVSNIVGNPSEKDNNGFIALVRADSLATSTKLVEGGRNGATLNAPKGMAIVGDTLWVADIDVLRGFNRRTGAPLASVSFSAMQATFLNDVAVGPEGAIFITDTGIVFDSTGATTHPGVDRIFKVVGRAVTEVASGDALASPNGLAWDSLRSRWILAPFGGMDIQALSEGSTTPTPIASGPGSYDGVELLSDGSILVSSWADSSVYIVKNGTMSKLISGLNAPADIGFDSKRQVIAIPRFMDGKVDYYLVHQM